MRALALASWQLGGWHITATPQSLAEHWQLAILGMEPHRMASTSSFVGWFLTTDYFSLAGIEEGLDNESESLIQNFHIDQTCVHATCVSCLTPPLLTLKLKHKSNNILGG